MRMVLVVVACLVAVPAAAGKRVRGYVTKRWTYVAPSYRSSPNKTKLDNYGTKGNINPYTGKKGTRSPWGR